MIPLTIYKRWGWQGPDHNISEREELEKLRQFSVDQGANYHSLKVLDEMFKEYETYFYPLY